MSNLAAIGAFVWFIGIVVLIVNTVGDSSTLTVYHVDVLGLAMSVSGAILRVVRRLTSAGSDASVVRLVAAYAAA